LIKAKQIEAAPFIIVKCHDNTRRPIKDRGDSHETMTVRFLTRLCA
jgi:hypothetical protein